MSQPLPTSKFKWVDIKPSQISPLATSKIKGYLLEVGVKYPTDLHDSYNDLPFMCDKMKINKVEKLVPNLKDKKNYVIHIRALDQVLRKGLVIERIHRAIEFNQTDWMKPYIDFNTKLRTAATNDFEKDFFKLMNNSVFGKTMKNIRKHRNIKPVTNKDKYLRTVMKPNFKSGVLFGENLMGCKMRCTKVVMKKPIYLSQTILDLSKIVMYEFHYDYMKLKFNKGLQLCYVDTDSLIYHIKTEDFYADIANDMEERFDTSGYIPDRPLPIGKNKKVIRLMKDELGGTIMTEFVLLRPKLYSHKKLDGTETPNGPHFVEDKKCKGIKKCVVKKTLEVNKVALNKNDDKCIAKKDGISTLARGHKDLSWSPTLRELFLIEKR